MIDRGHVVKVTSRYIRIASQPKGGCKNCSEAGACLTHTKFVYVDAKPDDRVQIGDVVEYELPERNALIATMLVFIFPLGGLFGGYFLGKLIFSSELLWALTAFIGLIISFGLLRIVDVFFVKSDNYRPVITQIIARSK